VKRPALLLCVLIAVATTACPDDDPGGDVVINAKAVPLGMRAVLLTVRGAATAAAAPAGSGNRVVASPAGDSLRIAVIAPVGATLAVGPLVRLTVPDRAAAASYVVSAVQASDVTNGLIPATVTFTVLVP